MSLSSTNRVSAAEAGIRDPFRELSKLLVSPDVEIGYQHWPSWYDLIGHIEEEYTGWVLTKTQVFGPPEMSKDSTPMEKSPGRTPSKYCILIVPGRLLI